MKNIVLQGFAIIAITGCTSIQINNTSEFHPESIRQVCIVNNPKVIIKDFNGIVERSFSRYGIEAKTYQENDILHDYGMYILGRMGIPYHEKGVNIISIAIDAPQDIINTLAGKLGKVEGISAKTTYSKM